MQIYTKKALFLTLAFCIGMQPTINSNYYDDAYEIARNLLREIRTALVPGAIMLGSTYLAALVARKVMEPNTDLSYNPTTQKNITFKDYIGVPEKARELVLQLQYPEKYKAIGSSVRNGILFTGPPGTGKTYLAQAIAGEVNCPFFQFSATDFSQTFIGMAKTAINDLYTTARTAAKKSGKNVAIIFIDEFDALGARSANTPSSDPGNDSKAERINTFLTQIDGFQKENVHIVTIGATNLPENIDAAFKRSGRFDFTIYVPLPTRENRLELIKLYAKNNPVEKQVNLESLADATANMSPADIKLLFNESGIKAVNKKKTTRDYDSFARTLWDIKESNYTKTLPSDPQKQNLINQYLQKLQISNVKADDILKNTSNMVLGDINEIFNYAFKFSQEKSEKSFADWLHIAIQAKKQQMNIRKNQEAVTICNAIYSLIQKNFNKQLLLTLQPEEIFEMYNTKYRTENPQEEVQPIIPPAPKPRYQSMQDSLYNWLGWNK